MALKSGTYHPKRDITVTVWPKPDVNGTGEPVFRDVLDPAGNFMGREQVMEAGQPVNHYPAPDGFVHVRTREPGADQNPDVHVRQTQAGGIHRNVNGHAVGIKPGSALVEYPDGTHVLLEDDYSQYLFSMAHDHIGLEYADKPGADTVTVDETGREL